MNETYYAVPQDIRDSLVSKAYQKRGFSEDESQGAARSRAAAARHGTTHNAIKKLCIWIANRKLSLSTAYRAIEEYIRTLDTHGIGMVSVDNAFHYLWGGGLLFTKAEIEAFNEFNVECVKEPWDFSSLKTTELS